MYKKIVFFSILLIFLFASFNFIENPNSNHSKDDGSIFAGEILESEKKLYSQHDEELIIRDFFNDRKGGIFVDVGCAHYMVHSTTYYLEKHLEWHGIAVDALAEFAIGYIQHRPNSRFFNFIVTDHSGGIEPFYRLISAPPLSSTNGNYTRKQAESLQFPSTYQVIYVPTITLTELLEKNGISKIDFLSMDIEGGELKALSGFDIERFKPELVCIEAAKLRDKIVNYFTGYGYERIDKYLEYDNINWYFKPID